MKADRDQLSSGFVIVDSSVWVDYLNEQENAHTRWLDEHLSRLNIGLTDLILCEVLQGYRSEVAARDILRNLSLFTVFDGGGEEMAIKASHHYRHLRGRGLTVRTTIDCMIATFCIEHGFALLHKDKDFDAFERHLALQVIHPPADLVQ